MSNKLSSEKSPYLLQHANNPVDWYPWGVEAFNKAKSENKPIFLSIGYSTCYWCHVMEREVFENPHIADVMNKMFVNIKVDREERPDVDRVYMAALQAMTGSGGWPMSMFLTPELKPFYGATYVPPTSKYNMPGFEDLITQINDAWLNRKDEVMEAGNKILEHLMPVKKKNTDENELNLIPVKKAIDQFKASYDEQYGGFGNEPKFPRPSVFNILLRAYHHTKDDEILRIVIRSLTEMANGGIYDHLGGGFHRYSVDRFWRVPHFEKMLYDQAQLVNSYLETYQLTNEKFFLELAEDILKYVSEKMTYSEGGFYSAEDAESIISPADMHHKEEGAYYVWEKDEIDRILGESSDLFCNIYGVYDKGNAPAGSDPHNVFINKNILYRAQPSFDKASDQFDKTIDEIKEIISECRIKLLAARIERIRPHLDDKILTSWNGLMISAYANAYKVTGKEEYLNIAGRAADFILTRALTVNGTLFHRWRDGESKYDGNLDDYAFFIQGLTDLYEASFEMRFIEKAIELNEEMIKLFYDNEAGGFYDTSGNDKSILYRSKDDYDSAEPSGNSIAIMNLIRLSEMLHDAALLEKAGRSLKTFADDMDSYPYSLPQMLCSLDYFLDERSQLVISGPADDNEIIEMKKVLFKKYIPSKILVYVDPEIVLSNSKMNAWSIYSSKEPAVYICKNFTCLSPVRTAKDLRELDVM